VIRLDFEGTVIDFFEDYRFVYSPLIIRVGQLSRLHSHKVTAGALLATSFSILDIISPQMFQGKDAPWYFPAIMTLLIAAALALILALVQRAVYVFRIKKKPNNLKKRQ